MRISVIPRRGARERRSGCVKRSRTRKILLIAALLLAVIGTILYKLADRYLIEHVEAVVTEEPAAAVGEKAAADQARYDDWNYEDDDTTIAIKKVQTGADADRVTYYVADVKLEDSSSLLTAFAKNKFGRNIIEDTSKIAADHNAVLAINGDYYGFRGDGVVIRNGELYRDEPARQGFALFSDGAFKSFDETRLSAADLLAQGAVHTFSFGPALVGNGEVAADLEHVKIDTNFGNRSIQGANPRTGIGMIAPNHYVFVVVDGRQKGYSRGMTLHEFAELFAELGCTEAYNLDGGGSSTMYFMGKVVNSPGSNGSERGVSDILYIAR